MANVPIDDATIKANLFAGVGNICNPTAMIRRDFIEKHALQWEASHRSGKDWGFFIDAMRCGAKFANVTDVLVRYRIHAAQISKDPSANRSVLASIRVKVMEGFFPDVTAVERTVLEPSLQWVPTSHGHTGPPGGSGAHPQGHGAQAKRVWRKQEDSQSVSRRL